MPYKIKMQEKKALREVEIIWLISKPICSNKYECKNQWVFSNTPNKHYSGSVSVKQGNPDFSFLNSSF